jgi:hypothetical protein
MRLDVRNNLYVLLRRLPRRMVLPYTIDWMRRYAWIAESKNASGPFIHGLLDGVLRSIIRPKRQAVSAEAFEQFAKLDATVERLRTVLSNTPARRVMLVDVGKNIYAYWRACRELNLEVVAVADNHLAARGRKYRGVPVVTDDVARGKRYDIAIIANLSPAHARTRSDHWRLTQSRPVIDLFSPEMNERFAVTCERPAASKSLRIAARTA